MIGDKLASGASTATFSGPRLKFDEMKMARDLRELPAEAFKQRYYMAQPEYELLLASSGESTDSLARAIEERIEAIQRLTAEEQKEDAGLRRECFIEPFVAGGYYGRIIVSRDQPAAQNKSKLSLPRRLRTERERLPTTGHVIKARVKDGQGNDVSHTWIGARVLFGPMSGTAVCFRNYPTWIVLDLAEVLGIIHKEDAEIVEEELEPLTA